MGKLTSTDKVETWLNTPDNRKGFASMLLDLGYRVYVVDQTSLGCGTQEDLTGYPLRIGSTSIITEVMFYFHKCWRERGLPFFIGWFHCPGNR